MSFAFTGDIFSVTFPDYTFRAQLIHFITLTKLQQIERNYDFRDVHLDCQNAANITVSGRVSHTDSHTNSFTISILQSIRGTTSLAPLTVSSTHVSAFSPPRSLSALPHENSIIMFTGSIVNFRKDVTWAVADDHSFWTSQDGCEQDVH